MVCIIYGKGGRVVKTIIVKYEDELYEVIFLYETGYMEIKKVNRPFYELVHVSDVQFLNLSD